MGRWSFALFVAYLATEAVAQVATWERQYGHPGRAEFATGGVVETPAGDFVLCGFTMGATSWDTDGLILKIDADGDSVWARQVGSTGFGGAADFLWGITLTSKDQLALTGSRYHAPSTRQVWFLLYDLDGNCLIDKQFGGPREDNGNEIIETLDGGYMILGDTETRGTQVGGKDVWLLKLDSQGDTVWTRTYDFGFEDSGTGIIPFKLGNYLLTTTSCVAHCGGLLQEAFCSTLLIDSLGNVLKRRIFGGKKNVFSQANPTMDGGAILCGFTSTSDNFPNPDVWIVKLDAEGEVSWSRTIGFPLKYDGGLSIFQSKEGGYYLAAYSQGVQTPEMNFDNWWLLRLTSAGDTLWTRWWGWPLNDDPYSLIPTSDGGLLIAGWKDANSNPFYSLSLGNPDIYIVKADSLGETVSVRAPSPLAPAKPALGPIWPNPLNRSATMRILLPQVGQARLEVFDARGRRVATLLEGQFGAGERLVQWDAGNLPAGLYFCRLTAGHTVHWTKMVVLK